MNSLILILNAITLLATGSLKDIPDQAGVAVAQPPIPEMNGDSMSLTDQSIYGSAAVRRQLETLSAQPILIPVSIPQPVA